MGSYHNQSVFCFFFKVWISFAQFESSTGTNESREQARFVNTTLLSCAGPFLLSLFELVLKRSSQRTYTLI